MTNHYDCGIIMERKTLNQPIDISSQVSADEKTEMLQSKGLTDDDWKKMSLMEKWKVSYNQEYADKRTSKMASYLGCCTLLYTAVTTEYCFISYLSEELFSDYSPMTRYYLRVFVTFIFIQTIANWLCTVCYQSDLRETRDNPDVDKLLWDEHPDDDGKGATISAEDCYSNKTGMTWKWCDLCKMNQPPRTHHCKVCSKCILKRDHHCFFTGTCIGYYNQRHFVFLVFYVALASFVYMPLFMRYMHLYYSPQSDWLDYFLPTVIYNWLVGATEFKWVIMVSHYYTVWWAGLMAGAFFVTQLYAISEGLTSHEMYKRSIVRCSGTSAENFRDVFGTCWALNFLFPTVILFKQPGDGKHWMDIKKI